MGNVLDCASPLDLPGNTAALPTDAPDAPVSDLESNVPIEESNIWALQNAFYGSAGPQAYHEMGIPCFESSNAAVARAYALYILATVQDLAEVQPDQLPLQVVELGAGHGRFSFLVLEALQQLEAHLPAGTDRIPAIQYSITDMSPAAVRAILQQPLLSDLLQEDVMQRGFVDLVPGKLRVTAQATDCTVPKLAYYKNGDALNCSPDSPASHAMLFISNYVLSSLPANIFKQTVGEPTACDVATVSTKAPVPARGVTEKVLTALELEWGWARADPGKPSVQVASKYLQTLQPDAVDGGVPVPVRAAAAIQSLLRCTSGQAAVLVADHGFLQPHRNTMKRPEAGPPVSRHITISVPVNFHFLLQALHAGSAPGQRVQAQASTRHSAALKFMLVQSRVKTMAMSRAAACWQDQFVTTCPALDACTVQRQVTKEVLEPSMALALPVLRMMCHDATVYTKLRLSIIGGVSSMGAEPTPLHRDLLQLDAPRTQANCFTAGSTADTLFDLGRTYMGLGAYEPALECFTMSNELVESHAVTWHNIGLCHYYTGDHANARAAFQQSLALDADNDASLQWLEKLEDEEDEAGGEELHA